MGQSSITIAHSYSSWKHVMSLTPSSGGSHPTRAFTLQGATNRPRAMDAAALRPGRFDVLLYVPPPDTTGRAHTLRIHARGVPLAADVDLDAIAADTELFTGALQCARA